MRRNVNHHNGFWAVVKMIVLTIITGSLLLGIFAVLWGYHQRQWDGRSRFTQIYLTPKLVIKSFDPKSKTGVVLVFPENLEIDSISGRGSWNAGVISKAGNQRWAADSVANYLGISYTGIGNALNWWDQLQWQLWNSKIEWTEINVADTTALQPSTTPDGVMIYQLSRAWDSKANQWFFDQTIESQLLGVVIVNTTTTSGLGASASRVVESMGFKVRSLTSTDQDIKTCILQTKPELKTMLAVRKLQMTFGCSWQKSEQQDLTLILGDQYRSWKTGD